MASIKSVQNVTVRRYPRTWKVSWYNMGFSGEQSRTCLTFKGACRLARRIERGPKQ